MSCWATSSRALALVATGWAAAGGAATVERRLGVMGTELHLEVTATDRAQALRASEAAVTAIEDTERRLSTWRTDTELAALNRAPVGKAYALSEATQAELSLALACAGVTGGAFDPTVGALVDAWDLRGPGRIPSAAALLKARERTGYLWLDLASGAAVRQRDVRVEEGGFGKGAALDRAAEALRAAGATSARIDLGGQVLMFGADARIPLAHPRRRDAAVLELLLGPGSVSTTGNSEKERWVGDRRVGHILDPRTGFPAAEVGAVAVVAAGAAWADCLSTALYVLGPDRALEWARHHPGTEVIVLEEDEDGVRVRASSGLRGRLSVVPGASVQLQFESSGGDR